MEEKTGAFFFPVGYNPALSVTRFVCLFFMQRLMQSTAVDLPLEMSPMDSGWHSPLQIRFQSLITVGHKRKKGTMRKSLSLSVLPKHCSWCLFLNAVAKNGTSVSQLKHLPLSFLMILQTVCVVDVDLGIRLFWENIPGFLKNSYPFFFLYETFVLKLFHRCRFNEWTPHFRRSISCFKSEFCNVVVCESIFLTPLHGLESSYMF